jgi:hypothetical protein
LQTRKGAEHQPQSRVGERLTVIGNHINNCQVLLFLTLAIDSIRPDSSKAGVGGLEHILPVSADEDGSQSIPRNEEISLAVPAVTVDDLDILLSIVTGNDNVACIIGGAGVTLGAGAVDGRHRTRGGRGSSKVRIEGDLERFPSSLSLLGWRESPYVGKVSGASSGEGTKVVSETRVFSETALPVLVCANHALSGIVNCEFALTDLKCFDIGNPFNLGDPWPNFFISILSPSSFNNLEKSGRTIFSHGGIALPSPSPHSVVADWLCGTGTGTEYWAVRSGRHRNRMRKAYMIAMTKDDSSRGRNCMISDILDRGEP